MATLSSSNNLLCSLVVPITFRLSARQTVLRVCTGSVQTKPPAPRRLAAPVEGPGVAPGEGELCSGHTSSWRCGQNILAMGLPLGPEQGVARPWRAEVWPEHTPPGATPRPSTRGSQPPWSWRGGHRPPWGYPWVLHKGSQPLGAGNCGHNPLPGATPGPSTRDSQPPWGWRGGYNPLPWGYPWALYKHFYDAGLWD